MTTNIDIDATAIEQAIINTATDKLLKSCPFWDACIKEMADRAYRDGGTFKTEFRAIAREAQAKQVEKLGTDIDYERQRFVDRAKKELQKKYDRAIREYVKLNLTVDEIREVSIKAVKEQVHRAFGHRAHNLAKAVIGQQDKLSFLLAEELGEKEGAA